MTHFVHMIPTDLLLAGGGVEGQTVIVPTIMTVEKGRKTGGERDMGGGWEERREREKRRNGEGKEEGRGRRSHGKYSCVSDERWQGAMLSPRYEMKYFTHTNIALQNYMNK